VPRVEIRGPVEEADHGAALLAADAALAAVVALVALDDPGDGEDVKELLADAPQHVLVDVDRVRADLDEHVAVVVCNGMARRGLAARMLLAQGTSQIRGPWLSPVCGIDVRQR
jgi:rhodanese-related sulfurtransferase